MLRIRPLDRLWKQRKDLGSFWCNHSTYPHPSGKRSKYLCRWLLRMAAMNHRAKEMGFDVTRLFEERLTNLTHSKMRWNMMLGSNCYLN